MRTLTDKERDMLLGYGVQSFRIQAGYIPKIAPENECNRVEFEIKIKRLYLIVGYAGSTYISGYNDEGTIGQLHVIEIEAKLCVSCLFALRHYYDSDTVEVWSSLDRDELCHACAAHKYGTIPDDIPF